MHTHLYGMQYRILNIFVFENTPYFRKTPKIVLIKSPGANLYLSTNSSYFFLKTGRARLRTVILFWVFQRALPRVFPLHYLKPTR